MQARRRYRRGFYPRWMAGHRQLDPPGVYDMANDMANGMVNGMAYYTFRREPSSGARLDDLEISWPRACHP